MLAADGSGLLALGGAGGRDSHLRTAEIVPLTTDAIRIQEWRVPSEGAARQRAAVVFGRESIRLLGGNRGGEGDAFDPERFVDEIVSVSLATMSSSVAGTLPTPRQSMAVVDWEDGRHLLLGGLGPDADGVVRTQADTVVFDAKSTTAAALDLALPDRRTQFRALSYDDRIWVFGGIDFTPGTGEATRPLDVLTFARSVPGAQFESSGIRLPRPRRSFAAARLGSKVWLIGGLGAGFDPVGVCDVFDFATQGWSEGPPPPQAWVSAQACALGRRILVAGGGTMTGRRFAEDRSLWAFDPQSGWSELIAELPFGVRHVTMHARGDRLWFVDTTEAGRITLRSLVPPTATPVVEASLRR